MHQRPQQGCLGDDECKGTCSNNENLRCMNTAECMSREPSERHRHVPLRHAVPEWDGSQMLVNARGCANYLSL